MPRQTLTSAHKGDRLSDTAASAYTLENRDSPPPMDTLQQTTSLRIAASEDNSQLPVPIYVGYLVKKEDALRLLEGSFHGLEEIRMIRSIRLFYSKILFLIYQRHGLLPPIPQLYASGKLTTRVPCCILEYIY